VLNLGIYSTPGNITHVSCVDLYAKKEASVTFRTFPFLQQEVRTGGVLSTAVNQCKTIVAVCNSLTRTTTSVTISLSPVWANSNYFLHISLLAICTWLGSVRLCLCNRMAKRVSTI
jgi:hypothetical protein